MLCGAACYRFVSRAHGYSAAAAGNCGSHITWAWLWSFGTGVSSPWLSSSRAAVCSTTSTHSNDASSSDSSKSNTSSSSSSSSSSSTTPDITTSTQQLRDLLNAEQLSYRARLSMLLYHAKSKHPTLPESVASNIAALKQQFGPDLVNRMLETAPTVATRPVDTVQKHYEGLREVLGGNDALARSVVARSADVLNRSPAAIAGRVEQVQEILQISRAEVLQLVSKAPALLWCRPARLAENIQFIQQVSDLSLQQVHKTFLAWPFMTTASKERLASTHQKMQALLRVAPEEMRRICKTHPAILMRDHTHLASFITHLSTHLQTPPEEVAAIISQHPSILSWNVSELINRMTVVCQVLRLPPALRASLLSGHNNALLQNHTDIPQRVEYLKSFLGLPESELLPLLHDKLSVLWLTTEQMDSKAACARSLALLHPAWAADLHSLPPQHKLRLLQLGPTRFWRLVFLVQTGQHDCGTFFQYLNMSSPSFDRLFPEYGDWLDRYNAIVSNTAIPLVPFAPSSSSDSPATYTPIFSDTNASRMRKGSVDQDRHDSLQQATGADSATVTVLASSSSRIPPAISYNDSTSTDGSSDVSTARTAAAAAGAAVPATPAAALATWWGVDVKPVEAMLAKLKGPKHRFNRRQWQERLDALQHLMAALGWLTAEQLGDNSSQSPKQDIGVSVSMDASNSGVNGASAATSSPLLPVAAAASVGVPSSPAQPLGQELFQEQQAGRQRRRRRHPLPQQHKQQARLQDKTVKQQVREGVQEQPQVSHDDFNLLPGARQALQHALASGHPAAVACMSVACHLAPFSQQLYHLPPTPPAPVAQFALQYPKVFGRVAFVANCRALAAVVRAPNAAPGSMFLRDQLQQASMHKLSRCLDKNPMRLKMVQFLIQTQQPLPWVFTFEQLLVHEVLGPQGKGGSRAAFVAAYPAYEDWEKLVDNI